MMNATPSPSIIMHQHIMNSQENSLNQHAVAQPVQKVQKKKKRHNLEVRIPDQNIFLKGAEEEKKEIPEVHSPDFKDEKP